MTGWSDELRDRIVELWNANLSASEITKRIFEDCNIQLTRNAVVGFMSRERDRRARLQGYPGAPDPIVVHGHWRKGQTSRPKPKPKPPAIKIKPEPVLVELKPQPQPIAPASPFPPADLILTPLNRLNRQSCRWPYGDVGTETFGFCGQLVSHPEITPYCNAHRAVAVIKPATPAEIAAAKARREEKRKMMLGG